VFFFFFSKKYVGHKKIMHNLFHNFPNFINFYNSWIYTFNSELLFSDKLRMSPNFNGEANCQLDKLHDLRETNVDLDRVIGGVPDRTPFPFGDE